MKDSIALRVLDPNRASREEWRAFHVFRRARAAEDHPGRPVSAVFQLRRDALARQLGAIG